MIRQRPGVTGKPVRLAEPPSLLAGREELLEELSKRLTGGDGTSPRTVALWGMGGVGKTSVALAYARQHLADVGLAWQFSADERAVLEAEFSDLAAQLGVRDIADTRDPVTSVHGALAAFPAQWLLVLDNAPDRASIGRFLPPAGPGRILITSQNPGWRHGEALQVPLLGPKVAADFMVTRTGDRDWEAAGKLAEMMDGLPLALEQAAAYILATGGTLAVYLGLFRQRRTEMLRRGEPSGYPGTVATTWSLAFAKLEQSAPEAAGLLRLLAYYAPEAVPLRLLLQPRPGLVEELSPEISGMLAPLLESELAAADAIAALRRYSLVTRDSHGAVSVHRLVQAVTSDQMSAELAGMWRHAAAVIVEAAMPDDPEQPDTWPLYASLLPHAQTVLGDGSRGMEQIALYLGHSGSYDAARDLQEKAYHARTRVLGPDHRFTLVARNMLAYWTGKAGDPSGARDQFAALLAVQERVLGPEDPATLNTLHNLARWTDQAGDPVAATGQYSELLPTIERVLGPDHPGTVQTRENLAEATGSAGDAAGARDEYIALLPALQRVLGTSHPETLNAQSKLANWTGEAGDPAGARDQYAALLAVQRRVVGAEHPDTLIAYANLASWTGEAGDPASARDQYAALLPIRERVLGPDHPDTLKVRANLAHWTGEAGDPAGARDQYAALLPIRAQVLGLEHPDTLSVRANLADWTGEAGDAAGARDQFTALVPIVERVLGFENPATLTDRNDLARWTREAGGGAGRAEVASANFPRARAADSSALTQEH